jgi:hypothetical protein
MFYLFRSYTAYRFKTSAFRFLISSACNDVGLPSLRQNLHKVILYHIPSAPAFIKPTTVFNTNFFCNSNLYRINEVTVPEWLKHRVSKAESQDILHRFFSQIVVYAVYLFLFKGL